MNAKWTRLTPLIVTVVCLPALVCGSQAVLPNQFVNGDIADADAVNANFAALANAINDNDTRLAAVEGTAVIRIPHTPGDDAASGAALRTAIDSIPTSASIASYKIQLEPGVYDVGDTALTLPDGLALCGSGRERTTIQSTASVAAAFDTNASVEIRGLTLHVRPPATGGNALQTLQPVQLVLRDVRIDYLANAAGGIRVDGGSIDMADTEVVVEGTGSVASPAAIQLGSLSLTGTEPTLTACCCHITVIGANTARGLLVNRGQAVLTNTTVRAISSTSVALNVGVNADASESIEAHGCRLHGFRALQNQGTGSPLRAACSLLDGQLIGATTVHCYDASFAAIP